MSAAVHVAIGVERIREVRRWIDPARLVAAIFLASCWLPLYALWRPLPSPDTKNDIVWMSKYTYGLATGNMHVFGIQDPYLRYVVQSTVLAVIGLFQTITVETAILVNAHLIILLEGLVTPLALYWFACRHHDRWTGTGVLGVLTLVQYHIAPWTPRIPAWAFDSPYWGTGYWTRYAPELLGKTWYLTTYWHYALAPAVIVVTFGVLSRIDRQSSPPEALQLGVLVGIVGGIQVIQAALTAATVGVVLLYRRAYRQLAVTAAAAAVIGAPTVVVAIRFDDAWRRMSTRRVVLETPNLLAAGVTLAGLVALGVLLWYACTNWVTLPHPLSAIPPVGFAWPAVALVAVLVMIPLSAGWYRMVAASLLKYGIAYLAGVIIVTIVQHGRATLLEANEQSRIP